MLLRCQHHLYTDFAVRISDVSIFLLSLIRDPLLFKGSLELTGTQKWHQLPEIFLDVEIKLLKKKKRAKAMLSVLNCFIYFRLCLQGQI